MANGFRVRDRVTGLVIHEITDRLTRSIGRFSSGSAPGSINVPDFAMGNGYGAILESPPPNPGPFEGYRRPRVTISGNTLSWDFPGPAGWQVLPCDIIYGVY